MGPGQGCSCLCRSEGILAASRHLCCSLMAVSVSLPTHRWQAASQQMDQAHWMLRWPGAACESSQACSCQQTNCHGFQLPAGDRNGFLCKYVSCLPLLPNTAIALEREHEAANFEQRQAHAYGSRLRLMRCSSRRQPHPGIALPRCTGRAGAAHRLAAACSYNACSCKRIRLPGSDSSGRAACWLAACPAAGQRKWIIGGRGGGSRRLGLDSTVAARCRCPCCTHVRGWCQHAAHLLTSYWSRYTRSSGS